MLEEMSRDKLLLTGGIWEDVLEEAAFVRNFAVGLGQAKVLKACWEEGIT